ncbi:uncharacterized protein LOC129966441 [Argiope bruennichi]|uniref:uncharacterized protein LOC129966441 n=1 Tax=Argiope bruennichi TaxID=94029 RepID=UPI0024942E3B|nr:uncharacterized protein LOC129966441 [Argiope bruennichi]
MRKTFMAVQLPITLEFVSEAEKSITVAKKEWRCGIVLVNSSKNYRQFAAPIVTPAVALITHTSPKTTNPQPSYSLPTPPQKTTTNPQPSYSLLTPPQKTTTNPQPSYSLPTPPQKTTTNPQPSYSLPTPPQKTTTNPQPSHSLPTPPQKTTTNPQPSHSLPTPPEKPPQIHNPRTHYPHLPKNHHKSTTLALITHTSKKTTTNPQPSHSSTLLTPAPFSSIGIHFPRRKRQTSSPQYSHSLPTPQMPHILDSQRYMHYRITQPYEDALFFPIVAHRFLTSFYSGITPSIASPHITANTNFP